MKMRLGKIQTSALGMMTGITMVRTRGFGVVRRGLRHALESACPIVGFRVNYTRMHGAQACDEHMAII